MLTQLKTAFLREGIDITQLPLTMDSAYVSQELRERLHQLGCIDIIIAGKGNDVLTIDAQKWDASTWNLTFPLCCFCHISCWLQRSTPWKRIKINSFWPCYVLLTLLWSHEPEAKPSFLRCSSLHSGLAWYDSSERYVLNLLREKHFHGVSSAIPHAYLLKSRYGKVSCFQICQISAPRSDSWLKFIK